MGSAVIVSTGKNTELGEIAARLAAKPPDTEFGRGIRNFGMMITRVIMLLVLFVLLVNIILHRPLLESFLFSVALAVGMTPELMPMIITITLAQGARRMAKKRVLVKQLAADEAIAAADTLLLTVPNQLGVDYNAHAIRSILKYVAPELGWR